MLFEEVIRSFHLRGSAVPLAGGQNTSVRVNDAVLKPTEDAQHAEFVLTILDRIHPQGYRLSKPVKSIEGTFVSDGWICTQFERGYEVNGNVKEKLQVSRLFHQDLSSLHADDLPQTDNPWAKAHRIAWQEAELPDEVHIQIRQLIGEMLRKVSLQEAYTVQLIHADLAGNILFDDGLPPLIIDFSPTAAPVEYAEAILICDFIAWQGSAFSEMDLLPRNEWYKEMFIRAVIFRLAVEAIFAGNYCNRFMQQYRLFRPIIDHVDQWT